MKQEDGKTGKEEEKGDVDKCRHRTGQPRKVKPVDSLSIKCTNPRSVVRTMLSLGRMKVGLSPMVYKYC